MRKTYNEKALNGLYHSNSVARTLLKELAGMPRQDETLVDVLENKLIKEKKPVSRREMVLFFKHLEEYGVGEMIVGRKGHPSRFRWEVDSINVGNQDAGVPVASPAVQSLITHRYQLRPELAISFELPTDITVSEAYRLTQFLSSLPFGTQGPV